MNVYDFAAELGTSVRPNQFRVHVNFPTGLVKNGTRLKKTVSFLAHTAMLPAYNNEDIAINFRGRVIHEVGETTYETMTISVYNNADFAVRTAFEEWVNAINDPAVIAGVTSPLLYKSDVMIEQLDRNNNTLRVYKLVGAVPTNTGSIQLDFSSGSEIEKFDVQFVYDYFVVGGKELLGTASS